MAWTYQTSGATGDVYVSTPNTLYVSGRTFVNGGVFDSVNEAFYIQDSWSLLDNRLTLNLGLRNDRFENKNVNGETYYKSGNQWAPRLAFAADPTGDGRTKVYGRSDATICRSSRTPTSAWLERSSTIRATSWLAV